MSYFLDVATIGWIAAFIAIGVVVYGFLDAERGVHSSWKVLKKEFGTNKYDIDQFAGLGQSVNGLLEIDGNAIGVNVRVIGDGILIRAVRSKIILFPWAKVQKTKLQPNTNKKIQILVCGGTPMEFEITLPWSPAFPEIDCMSRSSEL